MRLIKRSALALFSLLSLAAPAFADTPSVSQPADSSYMNPQGVYVRGDELVRDVTNVDPKSMVNPSVPVLLRLVDSKTQSGPSYLYKSERNGKVIFVGTKRTQYTYLTSDGQHIVLDQKVAKVKDLRNYVLVHPKKARMIAFGKRWWDRVQPVVVPATIIAQAFIRI